MAKNELADQARMIGDMGKLTEAQRNKVEQFAASWPADQQQRRVDIFSAGFNA